MLSTFLPPKKPPVMKLGRGKPYQWRHEIREELKVWYAISATWLEAVVLWLQLIIRVVVLFDNLVVTRNENIHESRADNKAMLDNVSIVVASRSSFSCRVRRISRAIKLIEIVANPIIQELIAGCTCRHNRGPRSRWTRKSARTIEFDLLIVCHIDDAVASGRIEKLGCARSKQERLWLGWIERSFVKLRSTMGEKKVPHPDQHSR